jgi:UDP-glucose 4-epimerase
MKKILITGARGFIGRHLSRFLASQGHIVIGLGYGDWSEAEALIWGVRHWFKGEINLDNLRKIKKLGTPNLVYHLAGGSAVSSSIINPQEDFFRSVVSTKELLEWLRLDAPHSSLVVASSAAVYGEIYKGLIPESAILNPCSPYGYHKHIMEQLCKSYSESYGHQIVIARLFSVFGTELKKQLLWELCERLFNFESFLTLAGTGKELRDWIHISDAINALSLIGLKKYPKKNFFSINIGTGEAVSVKQFCELIINKWSNYQAASKKSSVEFSGQSRRGDPFSLVADISYLRTFDFSCKTSLVNGIDDYIHWFRRFKNI